MSLREWAGTDAEWFHEAYTLLAAFREGQQMRAGMEQSRKQMQC